MTVQHSKNNVKPTPAFKQLTITPLYSVTNPTVSTNDAAYYLNRKSQTLRAWACCENAPIRPIRINGRLAWKVADIRRLLNGAA